MLWERTMWFPLFENLGDTFLARKNHVWSNFVFKSLISMLTWYHNGYYQPFMLIQSQSADYHLWNCSVFVKLRQFYLYSTMSQNHKIASKGLYNVYMWHLLSSTPSIRIWKISHKNPVTVDKSIPGIQYVANTKLLVSEDMCDCTTDVK